MDQHNTHPAARVRILAQVLSTIDLGGYYHVLTANGFNTWDQMLHITEEQLDGLGFKLGHRRRLQREIASLKATHC